MRRQPGELSPSIEVVVEQLDRLSLAKSDLARRLHMSREYVYRLLKGKHPFPSDLETLERIAEAIEVSPSQFPEYVRLHGGLCPSAKKVWARMRELGLSREALLRLLEHRISRSYVYGILRGEFPFPHNRSYVLLFAGALGLPPTTFEEFLPTWEETWSPDAVSQLEAGFLDLVFARMLRARGHVPQAQVSPAQVPLSLGPRPPDPRSGSSEPPASASAHSPPAADALPPPTPALDYMRLFPEEAAYEPEVVSLFREMGRWGIGVPELAFLANLPADRVRRLLFGQVSAAAAPSDLAAVREALASLAPPSGGAHLAPRPGAPG